ncbi:excisionase family DNA binding protein [Bacillus pakistanensis]|uniref:Excisionase family DNA binding protein n=1 Tax=Rossellomorea pakistanensis TaxID=992288 RepID=A0ABS2NIH4_9BACI|nr:excisionase family DNA-binding protein [Bacillus pakistanensis]MBM7587668.1 excisionase family DNA binding protein [Bacillus pakistanensis]
MYITIKEAAEYLTLPEAYIQELIQEKKIRAIFDGDQYLVNKDHFKNYQDELEKYKIQLEEWRNEPLPEDPDVKDED